MFSTNTLHFFLGVTINLLCLLFCFSCFTTSHLIPRCLLSFAVAHMRGRKHYLFFFSSASRPALVPSKAHQRAPFIVPRSHHAHVATQTHQKPSGWSWNRRQRSLFPPPPSPAPPLTPPCVSPTRYRERRGKGGYILRYFINSNNIMTYKQEQPSLYSLSVEVYYCVISAAQPCRSAAISRLF